MAALQHVGLVHRRPACRIHCYCGPYRSIQRIRTNRIQSVRSTLSMGKQFTRLLCRAYRQLCVLFHRRVAEKHTHFYHCPRHIRLVNYISMEKRTHLLQHDLPGGYCSGAIVPILSFRPVIDTTKCNGCQSCARNCKASCIDAKTTSSITAVAWLAWIVSKSAGRELYDTFPEERLFRNLSNQHMKTKRKIPDESSSRSPDCWPVLPY